MDRNPRRVLFKLPPFHVRVQCHSRWQCIWCKAFWNISGWPRNFQVDYEILLQRCCCCPACLWHHKVLIRTFDVLIYDRDLRCLDHLWVHQKEDIWPSRGLAGRCKATCQCWYDNCADWQQKWPGSKKSSQHWGRRTVCQRSWLDVHGSLCKEWRECWGGEWVRRCCSSANCFEFYVLLILFSVYVRHFLALQK